MPRTTIRTEDIADSEITNAKVDASAAIALSKLSTTGTASADTFLRGDNAWAEVVGGSSWQAVQTANFTAVAGNGYPINTTSGEITITLPASASTGDTIEFVDYAGTFDTYSVIINPNGLNIKGQSDNLRFKTERLGVKIVYVDATQGWLAITSRTDRSLDPFFSATGGTKTQAGGYDVHTFTSSGNLVVVGSGNVDILCIAGGGGGAAQHGGGGGAGGYRYITGVALTQQTYAVVVGAGGAAGSGAGGDGGDGSASSGLTYSSAGGGGGGSYNAHAGRDGGSGGGAGTDNGTTVGSGNTPSTSPSQGNDGGTATSHATGGGGGGGGSAAVGGNAATGASAGGVGGAGTLNNIDGNNYYWAGGGGGAAHSGGTTAGAGGIGSGGGGGNQSGTPGVAGTGGINAGQAGNHSSYQGGAGGANTGSGGGGSGQSASDGGAGGSGIVIIRYPS